MSEQLVVCVGAVNIDRKIQSTKALELYTSNPAFSTTSLGGVGRNVAENLSRLGRNVAMISVVGEDAEGTYLRKQLSQTMNVAGVVPLKEQATGMYTAILDQTGEMYTALADMSIYEELTPAVLEQHQELLIRASCIVADLNCPQVTLEYLCQFAEKHDKDLMMIAVSGPKMQRIPSELKSVRCLFVNLGESEAYFQDRAEDAAAIERLLRRWQALGVQTVVLTNGSKEIVVADQTVQWFSVKGLASERVVDVTGAGDSFSAAFIDALLGGDTIERAVLAGMTNAYYTIQTLDTVRDDLNKEKLLEEMRLYENE